MRLYIKPPFDGTFTKQYLYQKLLESDNYCWNYRWWLGGILFLRHSVSLYGLGSFYCFYVFLCVHCLLLCAAHRVYSINNNTNCLHTAWIISMDTTGQYGHHRSAWTPQVSMDITGQHGHHRAVWTSQVSMDITGQYGHHRSAWTPRGSMDIIGQYQQLARGWADAKHCLPTQLTDIF